jgi:oligopeptide transport system permease protein
MTQPTASQEHTHQSRHRPGVWVGFAVLGALVLVCLGSLPWTLGADADGTPRYARGSPRAALLPPSWWPANHDEQLRLNRLVPDGVIRQLADEHDIAGADILTTTDGPIARQLRRHWPTHTHPILHALGTDRLGRSLLVRCLAGGGISLGIGLAAAFISVIIGTIYGAIAGAVGGAIDAIMMRFVDILYGLPYILLVVLLAVASDSLLDEYVTRERARDHVVLSEARAQLHMPANAGVREVRSTLAGQPALRRQLEDDALRRLPPRPVSRATRTAYGVLVLLIAIGGVSWLTTARVIRGQTLSLKNRPFMEAARAIGAGPVRQFTHHLLPNLLGPIIVYATLTVPQAILQESFLSFLGIGVKPPLPSWGNLAADGLSELNQYQSHWWLLLMPCLLLAITLLGLNFLGERLRRRFDPKDQQPLPA